MNVCMSALRLAQPIDPALSVSVTLALARGHLRSRIPGHC